MTSARTHYEATLDVRYGMRFSALNERFYERIDATFGIIQLVGGSTAASSLWGGSATVVSIAGLVLAVVSVVERMLNPARKGERFAQARLAWAELDAKSAGMSAPELDAEIRRLQGALPLGLSALALPAFNANMLTHGHEAEVVKLPWLDKVACVIA